MDLKGVGIWSTQLRFGDRSEAAEAVAELDELGFPAVWIPDMGGPVLDAVENLLAASKNLVVATGILNLWMHSAEDVAAGYTRLTEQYGERFLLGVGVSHASVINADEPGRYRKPLAATSAFLDGLDNAGTPVPPQNRVLAALGPKMLALAADRTRGSHPYLSTPEHTAYARELLGEGPLLLPEQTAILTTDRDEARAIGVPWLQPYLAAPNYTNNWLRSGFTAEDIDSVSDRLFDALIVWGDEEAVLRRVREHQAAGADHVGIQVVRADGETFPREEWRRLAAALR